MSDRMSACFSFRTATLILRNFDMNVMPVEIVGFFPSLLDR
jgi:hypothetical protein